MTMACSLLPSLKILLKDPVLARKKLFVEDKGVFVQRSKEEESQN